MDALSPEQQRERDLWNDVFNPHESDREYFERRKRQLATQRVSGSGTMLTCAACGGRYEDAPGNFCSFCVS